MLIGKNIFGDPSGGRAWGRVEEELPPPERRQYLHPTRYGLSLKVQRRGDKVVLEENLLPLKEGGRGLVSRN